MPTDLDELRHQSEEHPLVPTTGFYTLEEYVLYLIHRVAYEEAAKFADGHVVLDVGCNNGYGTVITGANSRLTIGVDVSAAAVSSAQQHNPRANVRYQVIDGLSLPFDDATFDLVISFEVIEHVSGAGRYLAEIRRVLKPGGIALFTTPNAAVRLDPGMKPWNEFHVHEYLAVELRTLLEQWFADVAVRGLFARTDVYDVELRRVQCSKTETLRKRAIQKRPTYKAYRLAVEAAKLVLPKAVSDSLRRVAGTQSIEVKKEVLDENVMRRYSTADFFYRGEDLDRALEFMAVCTAGESNGANRIAGDG